MRMIEVCKLLRKPENVGNWRGRAIIMIMGSARDKRSKPIHPDTNLVVELVRHARDIIIKWMGYVIVENNKCCARTRQEQDKNKTRTSTKWEKRKYRKWEASRKPNKQRKQREVREGLRQAELLLLGASWIHWIYCIHCIHCIQGMRIGKPHRTEQPHTHHTSR